MTVAMEMEMPAPGEWTTDDLDELPEDGRRRELIDGVLFVSPSPTSFHQSLAMRLGSALENACPTDYAVTQGVEIRISARRSLTPDVLVVTAEADDRRPSHFRPAEVLLAVEIVSRGSVTMDRITKPALYAQAGIPFYWRIETNDAVLIATHRLDIDAEVYVGTGVHTGAFTLDEPFPLRLPLDKLSRRPGASA